MNTEYEADERPRRAEQARLDDLAAIEARHQPATHYTGRQYCALDNLWYPCDARVLLDKLADAHKTILALLPVGDRTQAERARFAEALSGLYCECRCDMDRNTFHRQGCPVLYRAAVLAIVEGEK